MTSCRAAQKAAIADVYPKGWGDGEWVTATYNNDDTVALYDVSVLIRYGMEFNASGVSIQIKTVSPDTTSFTDNIMLPIDKHRASKLSDYMETEVEYRKNVRLEKRGIYNFFFAQPAGAAPIYGIYNIGVILTPAND